MGNDLIEGTCVKVKPLEKIWHIIISKNSKLRDVKGIETKLSVSLSIL